MNGGRPRYKPSDEDRRRVTLLAGFGLTHDEICTQLINPQTDAPLSRSTLERAFRRELSSAVAGLNAQVAGSLFRKATGNGQQSVTAAIFWLKARAQWRTVDRTEVTGADGEPLQFEDITDAKATLARRLGAHVAAERAAGVDREPEQ